MREFLPRDFDRAVHLIKEEVYKRVHDVLHELQWKADSPNADHARRKRLQSELVWLEGILDWLEKH